jgi:D-alanine-D-alanine ligase
MKIAVFLGGTSSERNVSFASGSAIAKALQELGHDVIALDTAHGKNQPSLETSQIGQAPPEPGILETFSTENSGRNIFELIEFVHSQKIELVFNALHGGVGENGVMQALLDLNKIKYTGSGVLASALAMNKVMSKRIFESESIPTPHYLFYEKNSDFRSAELRINEKEYPIIVKPNAEGSTVGLTLVKEEDALETAWNKASQYGDILIESYIAGREMTVSVLGDEALPVIEIIPESGLYDYEHKYTKGKTRYVCPAEVPTEISAETQRLALMAFKVLGCKGYGRIDFRLSQDNQLYCLEANTLPGMTATSLVPKAAKAAGIEFVQLIDRIVRTS